MTRHTYNEVVSPEVLNSVKDYFKDNNMNFELEEVHRGSFHPEDNFYIVIARNIKDGSYCFWTCWNQSTGSLNQGHYGYTELDVCRKDAESYFFNGN